MKWDILLTEEELETVGRAIMGDTNWNALPDKNVWTIESEEIFANQLETYIKTGQAKRGLARVFNRMIDYLRNFYRTIKGTRVEKELNPELKKFFDEYIDIRRPSKRKILNSLPTHEHAKALKFFGHENNVIRTPEYSSNIEGVSLNELSGYADNQAQTILYKIEDDHFTELRNSMQSQEQAINELPWDEYRNRTII